MFKFAKGYKIDWRFPSIYNSRANGLAEAFNKALTKLLKKVVTGNKRDWHTKLSESLWAYRTTYKTPMQSTPNKLYFGIEVVLPLKVQLPSLRIAIHEGLTSDENVILRLEELEALYGEHLIT